MCWTPPPQEVELEAGDGIKDLVFFNDRLPGIHLIKVDSSDLSQPIANARFRFEAVDGSFGPVEYTTLGGRRPIDLSKLPVGSFRRHGTGVPRLFGRRRPADHPPGRRRAGAIRVHQFSKLPSSAPVQGELRMGRPWAASAYRLAKIEDGSRYLDRTTSQHRRDHLGGPGAGRLFPARGVPLCRTTSWTPPSTHVQLFPGKDCHDLPAKMTSGPNLTVVEARDADTGAAGPRAPCSW